MPQKYSLPGIVYDQNTRRRIKMYVLYIHDINTCFSISKGMKNNHLFVASSNLGDRYAGYEVCMQMSDHCRSSVDLCFSGLEVSLRMV